MVDQLAKPPVAVGIPLIFVHDFMLHVRLLPGRITRTLDNNVLATKVAKKVNKERTESKSNDFDRLNRENIVMALGRKVSTKVEGCEKSTISIINSRFQAIEG